MNIQNLIVSYADWLQQAGYSRYQAIAGVFGAKRFSLTLPMGA